MKLKPPVNFVWRGPHHLYIGLVLILFAWLMDPYEYYTVWTILFYILGTVIVIDDLVEHTITGSTPLRWFFEKILWPFMEWVNDKARP